MIDGTKAFITNSGTDITALVTVTAVTGSRRPAGRDLRDPRPGPAARVHGRQAYSKVGWHASDTHELSFADCRVPAANLLGERGRGYAQFLSILDEGRIAIAALARARPGLRRRVRPYAKEREAFGRAIGATRRSSSRSRTWRCGRTRPAGLADAAARLWRPAVQAGGGDREALLLRAAVDNAREATQVFGGYGFMNEFPVARHWRDSKILEIGEGTSEVQRMLIARDLGLSG